MRAKEDLGGPAYPGLAPGLHAGAPSGGSSSEALLPGGEVTFPAAKQTPPLQSQLPWCKVTFLCRKVNSPDAE
jgi:hypothetical protein